MRLPVVDWAGSRGRPTTTGGRRRVSLLHPARASSSPRVCVLVVGLFVQLVGLVVQKGDELFEHALVLRLELFGAVLALHELELESLQFVVQDLVGHLAVVGLLLKIAQLALQRQDLVVVLDLAADVPEGGAA